LRLLGHLSRSPGLLDDQVVAVGLDDAFKLRILVPGDDEKLPRLLPHPRIDIRLDGEVLGAVGVRALAEEDRLGRSGAVALLEAGDVLVDLAKERLVAGSPLLPKGRQLSRRN
jgi:hypothetical protein